MTTMTVEQAVGVALKALGEPKPLTEEQQALGVLANAYVRSETKVNELEGEQLRTLQAIREVQAKVTKLKDAVGVKL